MPRLVIEYIGTCPRCKVQCSFYLFYEDVEAGEVECKCGYKGMCSMLKIGRKLHERDGLINGDIIDPT